MWEQTVEPILQNRAGPGSGHAVRRIRTFGIGESVAAEMLRELPWRGADVEIGTRAQLDGLTVILRGPATPQGVQKLDALQQRVVEILGDRVFGVGSDGLPEITGELLRRHRLRLAVAESCTGGLVAKRVTDVPGSSAYFVGGVTAYENSVKTEVLGIAAPLLTEHGAVSEQVAAAMADRVATLLDADCAVSTTGIAGPEGGSEQKPVGLVYVGSVLRGDTEVERLRLFGRRDQIRERAAMAALDLLRRRLLREFPSDRPGV
jgi:nicotinamide-nucleotide amidase